MGMGTATTRASERRLSEAQRTPHVLTHGLRRGLSKAAAPQLRSGAMHHWLTLDFLTWGHLCVLLPEPSTPPRYQEMAFNVFALRSALFAMNGTQNAP